jgi:hypothetical protein
MSTRQNSEKEGRTRRTRNRIHAKPGILHKERRSFFFQSLFKLFRRRRPAWKRGRDLLIRLSFQAPSITPLFIPSSFHKFRDPSHKARQADVSRNHINPRYPNEKPSGSQKQSRMVFM